jgi:hypothetical protein
VLNNPHDFHGFRQLGNTANENAKPIYVDISRREERELLYFPATRPICLEGDRLIGWWVVAVNVNALAEITVRSLARGSPPCGKREILINPPAVDVSSPIIRSPRINVGWVRRSLSIRRRLLLDPRWGQKKKKSISPPSFYSVGDGWGGGQGGEALENSRHVWVRLFFFPLFPCLRVPTCIYCTFFSGGQSPPVNHCASALSPFSPPPSSPAPSHSTPFPSTALPSSQFLLNRIHVHHRVLQSPRPSLSFPFLSLALSSLTCESTLARAPPFISIYSGLGFFFFFILGTCFLSPSSPPSPSRPPSFSLDSYFLLPPLRYGICFYCYSPGDGCYPIFFSPHTGPF